MVSALAFCFAQLDRPDVPVIGGAAGITLGVTTVGQFEERHGPGLKWTGGHPRGGRSWYDPQLKLEIAADGFNYGPSGRVFDVLFVSWRDKPRPHVPSIRLGADERGLLGHVRRGMSEHEVRAALGTTQPLDEVTMLGLVNYGAKLVNKDDGRFQVWTATFEFGRKGLEGFEIMAD